ncbi:MAG: hypothetical protein KF857_04420 [Fimbriimonadaceae bacterium]|nr:hypothetical protein [Fimbriimonadaceae bacterium]
MPSGLVSQIDMQLEKGEFASVSEWIRHAIREQLKREEDTLERLFAENPKARESWNDLLAGRTKPVDLSRFED